MSKIDLGAVTAYADAVKQGYTGTREQFGKDQAEFAKNAAQVAENLKASEKVLAEQVNAIYAAAEVKKQEISDIGTVLVGEQSLNTSEQARVKSNIDTADAITETASGEQIMLTDASYQHFRGMTLYGKSAQNGTPTPSAPVEIVSAGDAGEIEVNVGGRQLLDVGESLSFTKSIKINVNLPAGQYTVGYSNANHGGEKAPVLVFMASQITVNLNPGGRTKTIILPVKETTVYIYSNGYSAPNSEGISATVTGLMLNVGDTALPFEPYITVQSVAVSTPDGLHGIPVTSGGNYTDADGQQWICDEIDFGRGVYVQRVGHEVITKTIYIGSHANGMNYAKIYPAHIPVPKSKIISDRYKGETWSDVNGRCYCIDDQIIFTDSRFASLDAVAEILSQESPEFYYIIAEPVETPLSETALAAYRALHTNKPHTTIFTDGNAGISVEYAADTKAYIDKKFAELRAELSNN